MLIIADMQVQVYSNPDMSRPPPSTQCHVYYEKKESHSSQIRHSIPFFLQSGHVQFPAHQKRNVTFAELRTCSISARPDMQFEL